MGRDRELASGWARTEALLREALSELTVDPGTRHWVDEYLDHNELGLAYETLVESLARPIPDRARKLLSQAAVAMELDAPAD